MISSHLSPEPERRIWILVENMRYFQADAERKLAAVAAVCLAELALMNASAWTNPPLAFAFLAGLAGYATPLPRRLDRRLEKSADDSLVTPEDLSKYTHGDLIGRLDKFLGGGITATKYYEDVIGELALTARTAARKRRALRWTVGLALLGQALLPLAR